MFLRMIHVQILQRNTKKSDNTMQRNTLNFTTNWNGKLFTDFFTTFRPNFPMYKIGARFDAVLNSTQSFGEVEVIEKKLMKLSDVNEFIARLDTGYDAENFKKLIRTIYKTKFEDIDNLQFCLLLLKKIKKQ